jgi:hypothetical protein
MAIATAVFGLHISGSGLRSNDSGLRVSGSNGSRALVDFAPLGAVASLARRSVALHSVIGNHRPNALLNKGIAVTATPSGLVTLCYFCTSCGIMCSYLSTRAVINSMLWLSRLVQHPAAKCPSALCLGSTLCGSTRPSVRQYKRLRPSHQRLRLSQQRLLLPQQWFRPSLQRLWHPHQRPQSPHQWLCM